MILLRKIAAVALFMSFSLALFAQDIKLPSPNKTQKSKSVVEALSERHSVREFGSKMLSNEELSNLCWAACGVARDAEHRTAPTAMNRKEIRLFVFTKEAVYEYIASDNLLKFISKGDRRKLIAGVASTNGNKGHVQDFVMQAPISLLMVIDFEKFGSQNEKALMMGCVDAGNVSENINLYCEAVGLCTVPRATMDVDGIRKLLGLSSKQLPIINNPVGFAK